MTNKMVILGIAILAIGLVALPETLALFAGQHDWYEVNQETGNTTGDYGIPCMKCHADVQQQMDSMPANAAHKTSVTCEECHIVSQFAKGATVGGTGSIHAAAAPACMDCHGNTSRIGYSYLDSNPSGTPAPEATSIYNGSNEAHRDFVNSAMDAGVTGAELMEGSNEACVACHTHVSVVITWNKPTTLSFQANSSNTGVWTVSNFVSSGVNTTQTSYLTTYAGGSN